MGKTLGIGNMRVLVVEDEPTLQDQLVHALSRAGYAVDASGDGRRADFLLRTETYDAVVLDLGLPGIDGLSLLTEWRASGIHVPVLVLTARSSWHEKVQEIGQWSADDYVAKPFRIGEVLPRVRALTRHAAGHAWCCARVRSRSTPPGTSHARRRARLTALELRAASVRFASGSVTSVPADCSASAP